MITNRPFNQIFVRSDVCSAWCELLWEEKGRVIILSDYGDWSYWWGHKGDMTMTKFLSGLDMEYMASKLFPNGGREYSAESTVQLIREHLISYRKTGDYTKDESRREWELTQSIEHDGMSFDWWLEKTEIQDAWEMSSCEVVSTWRHFWERLWIPKIRPALLACDQAIAS